jgi:heme exporter protein A
MRAGLDPPLDPCGSPALPWAGELAPALFAGHALNCRRGERVIFRALDFALEPGGALLLRGPNGSGKSSLLRLMAGLLRPAGGTITWGSAPLADDPERHRRRLAFLGHLDAVKPALTAAENLGFWCGRAAADAALTRLGIAHLAGLPARLLSAGQRRRLALARVVARGAPLWLLDEPTNALDTEAAAMFAAALAAHRAAGGMAVIALHGTDSPPASQVLFLGAPQGDEDLEAGLPGEADAALGAAP